MAKADLTVERLRELIHYYPETGVFMWLVKVRHDRPAGSIAGTGVKRYLAITLDQNVYYAHRLAWFYMTGKWPTSQIDHINRIKLDNRWVNLRDVSASSNCRNTVRRNLYGQGVKKNRGHTWAAKIEIGGVHVYLGNYLSPALAEDAFLACRELHSLGDTAMLSFAASSRLKAAKTVADSKLQISVNGELLTVSLAAKALGIPERTAYYRLHNGTYSGLHTPRT